jgi:NAD dependent epimerase/dehydratase family enzyme
VVIAGGSGFLGQSLARHLGRDGHDVVVLSRQKISGARMPRVVQWDARTPGEWWRELEGAEALVNLTGRSLDCMKTPDHCEEILRSRVESTRALGHALERVSVLPSVWVQMSTAHIYGDPPDLVCNEDSALGYGLAPSVGRAWEEAFAQSAPPQVRPVVLRTSFVLGRNGGAVRRSRPLPGWVLAAAWGAGARGSAGFTSSTCTGSSSGPSATNV